MYNMLCISAEQTQKGKENSFTHHVLIKLLIERSLRDVSPMIWDEFLQEATEQNIQEAKTKNAQEKTQ